MSYGRRRRRDEPDTRAKPFNDGRDSYSRPFFNAGANPFPSLAAAAPRSLVQRNTSLAKLQALDSRSWEDLTRIRGDGGAPHALSKRPRRVIGPVPMPEPYRLNPLLKARSYRSLNTLRADKSVTFCVRRKQRREVLFARKVAGRKGLGGGGVRRTISSSWSC